MHRMIPANLQIDTPDSPDYCYYPVTTSRIHFHVKAKSDARICLRTDLTEDSDNYEIILGGWGNTRSIIRRNTLGPVVAQTRIANVLHIDHYKYFWIQWTCAGHICVGQSNQESSILSYRDRKPFPINFIGVSTLGSIGEWTITGSTMTALTVRPQLFETYNYWVDYAPEFGMPRHAVIVHPDGLYVGRSRYKGSLIPGTIQDSVCYISWNNETIEQEDFQVLCTKDISWQKCYSGAVPLNALPAGETEDGTALFIGRIDDGEMVAVGRVQPNHLTCYVSKLELEAAYPEYDVLVIKQFPTFEPIGR